ncbi:MAG: DUF4440 domain-containing protein [Burkholderiales bacterium]
MNATSLLTAYIVDLEERLLLSETRRSPERLGALLAEGFVEFGADGGSHTKADVIASLQTEPERARALSDFRVTILADNVVLATYRATRLDHLTGEVVESLRSSVWTRVDEEWQLLFHQGTRVEAAHHGA